MGAPLYLFAKPARKLADLKRLRALFGIESPYPLDRLHSTLLPLGESTPETIDAARAALRSFDAEPFDIVFDHIDGSTLKPRKGLRAPGLFQRALARHFQIAGFDLPDYSFGLHLNLDYAARSDRRAAIPPFVWTVDEILLVESLHGHCQYDCRALKVRQYALAL